MDRENCRVFLLLTHSCAGGLPLGILLCQSEDEQTIAQGLEQLKQVVGEKGFAGRGHEGPQLVITDDCRAEREALGKAFPKATLLLCSFHLLQAVWRWLWSKESGVTHGDRPALFAIVKEMLYCQEIGSVDRLYSEARGHPVAASSSGTWTGCTPEESVGPSVIEAVSSPEEIIPTILQKRQCVSSSTKYCRGQRPSTFLSCLIS
ncbi:uncharacterized protein [Notothenia coriiceps]|uniref:MULE transposase domain-containing protein n=1 Tax=Notothenia coriiceps TaxID=8208 RepID=A0A6I9MG13_9TELE|nr:PREDICTED: uncharacterized protein LOC104941955 [Notothenia coriiceps]